MKLCVCGQDAVLAAPGDDGAHWLGRCGRAPARNDVAVDQARRAIDRRLSAPKSRRLDARH